jgi:endo-1,4-beta-xylanase
MSVAIEKVSGDVDVSHGSRASKIQALMDYMSRLDESGAKTSELDAQAPLTDSESTDDNAEAFETDGAIAEISAADMTEIYAAIQQQMTGSKAKNNTQSSQEGSGSEGAPTIDSANGATSLGQKSESGSLEEILSLLIKLLTSLKSQLNKDADFNSDSGLANLMQTLQALTGEKSSPGVETGGANGGTPSIGGGAGLGGAGPSTPVAQPNQLDNMDIEQLLELLRSVLGGQKSQQSMNNTSSNLGAGQNGGSSLPAVNNVAKAGSSDINMEAADLDKLLSLMEKLLAGLKAEAPSNTAPNGGIGGGNCAAGGNTGALDTGVASESGNGGQTDDVANTSNAGLPSTEDQDASDLESFLEFLRQMLGGKKQPQLQLPPSTPSSGGGSGMGGVSPTGNSSPVSTSSPSVSGNPNPTLGNSAPTKGGEVSPLSPSGTQSGGPSIKNAAAKHGMYAGGAVDMEQLNNPAYQRAIKDQFNVITPENSMKWGELEKNGFGPADKLVDWAAKNDIKVRGHALVWHEQAPDRIQNMSGDQLQKEVNKHISDTMKHFGDKVGTWDVVNETFSDGGKGGFRSNSNGDAKGSPFNDKVPGGGQAFLDSAFKAARAAGPKAELVLNDYNVETINPKSDAMFAAVKSMKERGIPIDTVGFQGHVKAGQDLSSMEANIKRFKDIGVNVQITELDVAGGSQAEKIAQEKKVFDAAAKGGASGVSFWGVSDAHSWIGNDPGLALDKDMKVKEDLLKALGA